MDAEGAGRLTDGFSFVEESLGEIPLLNVHLLGAPEANTTFLSVGAPGSCALSDQVAFKLSYPSKNGHDHFASVRGCIRPRLRDGLEAGSSVADHFNYLEQIAGGAGQAIELPDGYDVTFAKLIKHPVQFGSIAIRGHLTKGYFNEAFSCFRVTCYTAVTPNRSQTATRASHW
jgi:hypothetical protein